MEKDVTMSETTAEIEIGAAASKNSSKPAKLRQAVRIDHGRAVEGCGCAGRFTTFAVATGGGRENRNQPPGV